MEFHFDGTQSLVLGFFFLIFTNYYMIIILNRTAFFSTVWTRWCNFFIWKKPKKKHNKTKKKKQLEILFRQLKENIYLTILRWPVDSVYIKLNQLSWRASVIVVLDIYRINIYLRKRKLKNKKKNTFCNNFSLFNLY